VRTVLRRVRLEALNIGMKCLYFHALVLEFSTPVLRLFVRNLLQIYSYTQYKISVSLIVCIPFGTVRECPDTLAGVVA
jgi:hypothetical protein